MKTKVIRLTDDVDYSTVIDEAAQCLARGGVVAFPTETVYGVGANAIHPQGLQRLREVKGREETKPFTVHVGSRSAVHDFVPNLQGTARRLAEKGWPGPLTLIFQVDDPSQAPVIQESDSQHISSMYHQGTIGIRCPDDLVASDILIQARVPVVAASANPAGVDPPVTGQDALRLLDGQVDMLIDAGRSRYAKPSTIVKVNAEGYEIVREGVFDARIIRRLTQMNILLVCSGNTCRSPMAAALFRHALARRLGVRPEELADRGYHVESAGISAYGGAAVSPGAVNALAPRGIDISQHRSQPLTFEEINRADYIFTMTRTQLETLRAMMPEAGRRATLLDTEDIEDPIGASDEFYVRCAERIEQAIERRLKEIPL